MTRASMRFMVALMVVAPVAAADEPACANCWDGPEMFEYGLGKADRTPPDSIVAEDIGSFPDSLFCEEGSIVKSFGGADWLVTGCVRGLLKFSSPQDPNGPTFFISREDLPQKLPENARAKAAYLELRKLTRKQWDELAREVRDRN